MPIERSSLTECWVGFVLSSPAGDEGQQRQVDVDGVVARQIVTNLADCLEERQALDIADSAADLAQDEIVAVVAVPDEILDRVGDVRDHLHGAAEIIAPAFLGQNFLIDATGGDVVLAGRRAAREALIVAKVEVGLGPVVVTKTSPCWYGDMVPGSTLR